MNEFELAVARGNGYGLLSSLFLEGVTEQTIDLVRDFEGVPDDAEQWAARHQTLFGFHLIPHEGIFLETAGLLGGESASRVHQVYQRNGFGHVDGAVADHIGHQLSYLSFLCGAEADAIEDERGEIAKRVRARTAFFLQGHLGRWIAPFVVSLQRQSQRFYANAGEILWELVTDHARDLDVADTDTPFLPDAPDLLGDENTNLKAIAEFLMMPALSGMWLGQEDVGRLGQKLNIPRGFGNRVQTLSNLMRSAVQYDAFNDLITALRGEAEAWGEGYSALDADPFTSVWQERTVNTLRIVDQILTEAN